MLEIINVLVEALKLLVGVATQVIKNPWASIVMGALLAFGGRHIIYGIGLALLVYGIVALLASHFGFKLVP